MTALSAAEVFGKMPGELVRERFHVRVESCACGTQILAENDQATWTDAVGRHNRGTPHLLWWLHVRREWQGEDAL